MLFKNPIYALCNVIRSVTQASITILTSLVGQQNDGIMHDQRHVYMLYHSALISLPFSYLLSVPTLFSLHQSPTEELKRFAIIMLRIEITHPFVHNGDCIVTGPSEMNPLEMLENKNEPQTVLISNLWGNLQSLTTICAFEHSKLANFCE